MLHVMSSHTSDPSAAQRPGALLGGGAVIVWNDVAAGGRALFYEWHDKEHIPERLAIPGFQRGRRFSCVGHSPEWLTLYEADSLDVLVSQAYLARLNAPTPATIETLRYFANTSRAVCRVVHSVGSSTGGHVLALRMDVDRSHGDAVSSYLGEVAFPKAMTMTGIVACHLCSSDASSFIDTAESRTRDFDVPSLVVLIEASTADAACRARLELDEARLHELGAGIRCGAAVYSLEISRLATPAETC
jgi:hypothetical protein